MCCTAVSLRETAVSFLSRRLALPHASTMQSTDSAATGSTCRLGVLRYPSSLLVSSNSTLARTSKSSFPRHMRQRCKLFLLLLLWAAPLLCLASSPTTPAASAALATPLPQQHKDPTFDAKMASTGTTPSTIKDHAPGPQLSKRALDTEPAHIEAVLSRYAGMSPPPANLTQGVAHWDPPPAALQQMVTGLQDSTNHKYGPALGLSALREALAKKLERENGLDMTGQEVPYRSVPA